MPAQGRRPRTRPIPSLLADLAKVGRLARDFPGFLRTPVTTAGAVAIVRERLATRERRFLRMLDDAIYANARSPYGPLLRAAGCERGDIEALVTAEGLEGALTRLARAGVYVSFDEFKGRTEIVRGNLRLACREEDFDPPGLRPHVEARSGGTRGPATPVKLTLDYFRDLAVNNAVALDAHGLSGRGHVIWLQGFAPGLAYAALGHPVRAWFYPVSPLPWRYHAVAQLLALAAWREGHRLPLPRFLDVREPGRLAAWLAARRREGHALCVTSYASSAVRTCLAAREQGLALDGTCFVTLGEPFTEAKRRAVEAVGARALVRYAMTEAGILAFGCGTPRASDDVHFFRDSYGLIRREREVAGTRLTVEGLLLTSLLRTAPKVLLNVESGDYGRLERRDCACPLGALGLTDHLSEIRSFEKLSSEGMTFVRTDLVRILEEVLPARFGGTSADYQLVEEEAAQGILRAVLLVSPALGPLDEATVREAFLDALGATSGPAAPAMWRRLGTVAVRRAPPVPTGAGKVLPFHLLRGATAPDAPR